MFRTLSVLLLLAGHALAADPQKKGEVTLTAKAVGDQVEGWPFIVEVKLTNAGKDPISWWSGGPGVYPGAEHFLVEFHFGHGSNNATKWEEIKATNGQY